MSDPRPLIGEPLAMDLLNTWWVTAAGRQDLLVDVAGLATWLDSAGLAARCRADEPTLAAVLAARDALAEAVNAAPGYDALNKILDHGRVRLAVVDGEPREEPVVDDPAWLPAWLAARDYLGLLSRAPSRIRRCANPACVLHFFDVSRNGTRSWCSMAMCGNRAKAARHYSRARNS